MRVKQSSLLKVCTALVCSTQHRKEQSGIGLGRASFPRTLRLQVQTEHRQTENEHYADWHHTSPTSIHNAFSSRKEPSSTNSEKRGCGVVWHLTQYTFEPLRSMFFSHLPSKMVGH